MTTDICSLLSKLLGTSLNDVSFLAYLHGALFPAPTSRIHPQLPEDPCSREVVLQDLLNLHLLRLHKRSMWSLVYEEWTGVCVAVIDATKKMDMALSLSDAHESLDAHSAILPATAPSDRKSEFWALLRILCPLSSVVPWNNF